MIFLLNLLIRTRILLINAIDNAFFINKFIKKAFFLLIKMDRSVNLTVFDKPSYNPADP